MGHIANKMLIELYFKIKKQIEQKLAKKKDAKGK